MDSFFLSETLKYLYLLFDASVDGPMQVGRGKEGGSAGGRKRGGRDADEDGVVGYIGVYIDVSIWKG